MATRSPERVMDLFLWRHAEAEDDLVDATRKLTKRGRKQAKKMADWLNAQLPRKCKVLVSPARRAQQTAAVLERPVTTDKRLDVDAAAEAVLAAAGWPKVRGTVVIVGHQPTLGQAAALALTGRPDSLSVKKAGVWWLTARTRRGKTEVVLTAVVGPDTV
jgi:phosphohistidine phosphatase